VLSPAFAEQCVAHSADAQWVQEISQRVGAATAADGDQISRGQVGQVAEGFAAAIAPGAIFAITGLSIHSAANAGG